MKEAELDIYYDHYKDTVAHLKEHGKQRNRYFTYLIILMALVFLNSTLPNDFNLLANAIVEDKTGITTFKNLKLLDSVLLFSLLIVLVRYYQSNLLIERQYEYVHGMEDKLNTSMTNFKILREGKAYLTGYPIYGKIVHRIYTIGIPVLLIVLLVVKWTENWAREEYKAWISYFSFNTIVIATTIVLTLFYLVWLHFRDFKK